MSHLDEVLARRVDKWRADRYPAADFPAIGEIFEWASDPDMVGLSDIPERKTNLAGRYEVPVGRDKRTVAVKLIDMLGEEVLTTHPLLAAGS